MKAFFFKLIIEGYGEFFSDITPIIHWLNTDTSVCLSFLSEELYNGGHSPIFPQVASLYQRWLGKRSGSDSDSLFL
jgi:hypothetical protein